jgi:hypothetical protein
MKKHTQGPWTINDNGGNAVLIEAEDYEIGIVHNAGPECLSEDVREESMANARLIAAAPELLERLTELVEYLGEEWEQDEFIVRAKQAIQKAKGTL